MIAEPAYVGTVSERSMEDTPISSQECLHVFENRNFITERNEKFNQINKINKIKILKKDILKRLRDNIND